MAPEPAHGGNDSGLVTLEWPGRALKPRPSAAPRRNDSGLVTLEWLLIVAAAIGLAASSVLAVQQVLDGAAEVPDDPAVRVVDADIAAAFLAEEANAAALDGRAVEDYGQRCQPGIRDAFSDVVRDTEWMPPTATESDPPTLVDPAQCKVALRGDLGG